jgi:tryptophan-rich sensory protein
MSEILPKGDIASERKATPILALLLAIAATMLMAIRTDSLAAWLLAPYLA